MSSERISVSNVRLMQFPEAKVRDAAVDSWLTKQTDELHVIARKWFERMRQCGGDVRELMHDGAPTACVEDAAFAYVNVFRAHVNVGFFCGSVLKDPAGLLQGTGKYMRHVKLRPGEGIQTEALNTLIDEAYAKIKARLKNG
jgi:hypothetical protein